MGTAFVAGATGYTGRAVVEELRHRGVATVAHVRPGSSSLAEARRRFEELGAGVDTTPWEPEAMAITLRRLRPTLVFSLLGTTRKRARGEGMRAGEAYERIDYGLTALLLDAAAGTDPRPRFVYLSAVGVEPGLEPASGNAYMKARARAEAMLRASGLPFVVARPSFVTGPDRRESRPPERIAAAATDALLGAAARMGARRLRDRYASLGATTLARALVTAALDPPSDTAVLEADALRRLA